MENATKALVMAGSVLIAIIIIALLYSFISTLSANAEQEDLQLLAKQTEKFNKEYEAFQKKILRGTDVITVINKAITNNKKYEDQEDYYVKVNFKLKTAINELTEEYVDGKLIKTEEVVVFEPEETHRLDYSKKDIKNEQIAELGTQKYRLESYEGENDGNYKKIYMEFTVFKRKMFKCTDIQYNAKTGRVNLLEFEEYNSIQE